MVVLTINDMLKFVILIRLVLSTESCSPQVSERTHGLREVSGQREGFSLSVHGIELGDKNVFELDFVKVEANYLEIGPFIIGHYDFEWTLNRPGDGRAEDPKHDISRFQKFD